MDNPYPKLSDSELTIRCSSGDDKAWNEFFRRYNYSIDRTIVRTMIANTGESFSGEDEEFWDIKGKVIERILIKINEIREPSKIRSWVARICNNETIEWLRKKSAKSKAYQTYVENTAMSLEQPLDGEGDITLADLLPIENEDDDELGEFVQEIEDSIDKLDEKYRLALKLLILFYNRPNENDILEIARIRNIEKEVVEKEINEILDQSVQKQEEILKKEARKAILWAYIRRLESRIAYLKSSSRQDYERIQKKEEELQKSIRDRESLLKKPIPPVVPSYKDIARILGWGEEKAKALNILFFRARKLLRKRMRES